MDSCDVPNNFEIHFKIIVHNFVSGGFYVFPGNMWVLLCQSFGKGIYCFADDFNLTHDGSLRFGVIQKGGFVKPFGKIE